MSNVRNIASQETMHMLNTEIDNKSGAGGKHVYMHCISQTINPIGIRCFIIISQSAAAMDNQDIISYIKNNGFYYEAREFLPHFPMCGGRYNSNYETGLYNYDRSDSLSVDGIDCVNNEPLSAYNDFDMNTYAVSDTVITLL